jgi:hypothetical protein
MRMHHVLGLVLAVATVGPAVAQTNGSLRWRSGSPLGLQAGQNTWRVPCGGLPYSCDAATLNLYSSETAPRSVGVQVAVPESDNGPRGAVPPLSVNLVGQAGIAPDWGLYGRVGTRVNRVSTLVPGSGEGGLTYGVGLSWGFSRRGSAALGLDSYDVRGSLGEVRDVRTSLGLQWRY